MKDIKKFPSFLSYEIVEEDIGAMAFSEKVIEMAKEQAIEKADTTLPADTEAVTWDETQAPAVEESAAPSEAPTIEAIKEELDVEDKKEELLSEVTKIVDESEAALEDKKKSPTDVITELAESFYAMYDELASQKVRLEIQNSKLNKAYEEECEAHEELKLKVKKWGDIDEDVRFMSKLKKDPKAVAEYQERLLEEVAEYYWVPARELAKDLKEKKAKMAQALGSSQNDIVTLEKPEKKVEKPLFTGFSIK